MTSAPDPSGAARRAAYVVDGARTPFLRARGRPGSFSPVDLAVACGRPLLLRQNFAPDAIDEVILGCVNPIADELNPGRVAALRFGLDESVPGWTVQRNCGSGMQSIDAGFRAIEAGRADLILAGGTEAMSWTPLFFRQEAASWFGALGRSRGPVARLKTLMGFRFGMLKPIIGLERGLTDPVVDLNMGQTAEILGYLFDVTRQDMDRYAVESHLRLARAQGAGWLGEIEPMFDRDGTLSDRDDGVRADSSLEALAKLKPAFEPPFGKVTAGNSAQITDGATWVILASESAVEKYRLVPLARLIDSEWAGLDPRVMGLGPTRAATPLLVRHELSLADIAIWEINEAFAAQVLACLKAWADDDYCRTVLGIERALGLVDQARLNVDGGAIGLGHPVGTSGARIVLHLVHALRRLGGGRGIATECIGGGQGGAMLLEAV
jgi:acetyl-CoA C-acetyltransferase